MLAQPDNTYCIIVLRVQLIFNGETIIQKLECYEWSRRQEENKIILTEENRNKSNDATLAVSESL